MIHSTHPQSYEEQAKELRESQKAYEDLAQRVSAADENVEAMQVEMTTANIAHLRVLTAYQELSQQGAGGNVELRLLEQRSESAEQTAELHKELSTYKVEAVTSKLKEVVPHSRIIPQRASAHSH